MTAKIQAYNTKQLAQLYKVSTDTLSKWLQPFKEKIGDKKSIIYTPKQVQTIFECLGEP